MHLHVLVTMCPDLPIFGSSYMLLNINDTDYDAAHLTKERVPTNLTAGAVPFEEGLCWHAHFSDFPVDEGIHALQFSARDGALEPSGLESETCYVHIHPENLPAHDMSAKVACSRADGAEASSKLGNWCSARPLQCLPQEALATPRESLTGPTASFPDQEEPKEAEWSRFEKFKTIVCSKCEERGIACGCQNGEEQDPRETGRSSKQAPTRHPAFDMLSDFTRDMLLARTHASTGNAPPAQRVVINLYKQGLSNQLLSLVNALLLALLTNRLLAVHIHTTQVYELEPVIDLNAFANGLVAPCSSYVTIDMQDAPGLAQGATLYDGSLAAADCLVLEGAAGDVHLY